MTKLKQFLEVYKPQAKGEQEFVDKHVVIKHKDRNGNGDDVFKAKNIKTVERESERHGHSSGNDEKVYESVDPYTRMKEIKTILGRLNKTEKKLPDGISDERKRIAIKRQKLEREHDVHARKLGIKEEFNEDVSQIDELSTGTLDNYKKKSSADSNSMLDGERKIKKDASERKFINRNTGVGRAVDRLTKEELEEDANKESFQSQVDEVSQDLLNRYRNKSIQQMNDLNTPNNVYAKRDKHITRAVAKIHDDEGFYKDPHDETTKGQRPDHMKVKVPASNKRHYDIAKGTFGDYKNLTKEEVEALQEISKKTLGSYIGKARQDFEAAKDSKNEKEYWGDDIKKDVNTLRKRRKGIEKAGVKFMNKEDVINTVLDKYMPEINEHVAFSEEEKIIAKIDHLSDGHIHMILDLYHDLNEDNQARFMDVLATPEGINSLIDLAIENNRGE